MYYICVDIKNRWHNISEGKMFISFKKQQFGNMINNVVTKIESIIIIRKSVFNIDMKNYPSYVCLEV